MATLETIADVGIGRTTHRAVAARAGLPLGATTYYFPTLDDLVAAALRHATAELTALLKSWASRVAASADRDSKAAGNDTDLPAVLTELSAEYLADRRQVHVEYELYVAAARDETLRPLAQQWLDGFRALLEPYVGDAAEDVVALVDGAMLQALVSGRNLDPVRLASAIQRLIKHSG